MHVALVVLSYILLLLTCEFSIYFPFTLPHSRNQVVHCKSFLFFAWVFPFHKTLFQPSKHKCNCFSCDIITHFLPTFYSRLWPFWTFKHLAISEFLKIFHRRQTSAAASCCLWHKGWRSATYGVLWMKHVRHRRIVNNHNLVKFSTKSIQVLHIVTTTTTTTVNKKICITIC